MGVGGCSGKAWVVVVVGGCKVTKGVKVAGNKATLVVP